MAFASTGLQCVYPGNLQGEGPKVWYYDSPDPSTGVGGVTGYFAGMGAGSIGGSPVGMSVGDLVGVSSGGGVTWHRAIGSTLNAAGTYSSTYGYDVTVSTGN